VPQGEQFDVRALCEFTQELGLDAIDWVTTYGHEPAAIRKITDDFGLANICYTFFAISTSPAPRSARRDARSSSAALTPP